MLGLGTGGAPLKKILGTIRSSDLQRLRPHGPMSDVALHAALRETVRRLAPTATAFTVWMEPAEQEITVEVDLPDGDPLLAAPPLMIGADPQ